MVAAISARTPNPKLASGVVNKNNSRISNNIQQNPKRHPLFPSEAENGPTGQIRRPKSREVTSRYMSSSSSSISTSSSSNSSNSVSSRRSASPMVSRTMTPTIMTPAVQNSARRAQSAERRRPGTPKELAGGMSSAAKMLMTSKRSLSVSFQGESFSMAVNKAKPAPAPAPAVSDMSSLRKGTPERRKTTPVKGRMENSSFKPCDQQRWPGRSKPGNSSFLTRSLDYGAAADKSRINGSTSVVRAMQKSIIGESNRPKTETRFESEMKNVELVANGNSSVSIAASADAAPSDCDSVSSGGTIGLQEGRSVAPARGIPRGIVVPARFREETNIKLRRVPEPVSPMSKVDGSKLITASELTCAKKILNDSPISSPRVVLSSRGVSSPLRAGTRPASPNKCLNSSINTPFRGMPSPTRMRNGMPSMLSNDLCSTPSILSFTADMRRGKVGENRIIDAHELRLLYNRQLQWRFVNARAEAAQLVQTETAERSLYNAWVTSLTLRNCVSSKRMELQLLSQNLRLFSILNGQIPYLENWDIIERDHYTALSGAIEALKASTVRLPVVGGTMADIQDLKSAICSAVDVMQAMTPSIGASLPKVEQVNTWISELASLTSNERALINQCKDLLSKLTEMEVKGCSLRAHTLQLRRLHPGLITEV